MNRKDIIIIAVLMNTGLLAILFMMAGHTAPQEPLSSFLDSSTVADTTEIFPRSEPPPPSLTQMPTRSAVKDELDSVVKAYAANIPPQPVFLEETIIEPKKSEEPQLLQPEPVIDDQPKYVEVKVKRGDSLDKIARANGTTIRALKSANNLKSDRLQIGQILRVPLGTKKAPTKENSSKKAPSLLEGAEYYTIKRGDNPWKIAKQFHVRFDQLLSLNKLDEDKARNLKVGDKIRVR